MANEQNLVHFTSEQSHEEAVKNGRKGGKASGQARRERKIMREALEQLLTMPICKGEAVDLSTISNIEELVQSNITVQYALCLELIKRALQGNIRAFNIILELIGEAPKKKRDYTIDFENLPCVYTEITEKDLREMIESEEK